MPQQSPGAASVHQNGTTTTTVTIANGSNGMNGINGKTNGQPMGAPMQHHVTQQHQPQQHIQATTTIHAIKEDPQQPMVSKEPPSEAAPQCVAVPPFSRLIESPPCSAIPAAQAPMAFYPTWQATDPSQGWQNQFIQQIPQNTTATATIAPLNTIEFQPQSYAYPANGYVQTGIGFDPNYGRTYAAPTVQRYEFQAAPAPNQINQVSLQNVSFATTAVTYAGQVATGPSPVLLANGGAQQSISMAGNDLPGCPRVSSVPPPSLSYNNGYSGDLSGKPNGSSSTSTNSTPPERSAATPNGSLMNPPPAPHVTQSPGRAAAEGHQNGAPQYSPNPQVQHSPHHYATQPQQPSPNPHLNLSNVTSFAVATPSPSGVEWDWSNGGGSSGDMYNQQSNGSGDRLNLNTRLKTMILNKGEGHGPPQGMSSVELSPPPSNGSAHGQPGGAAGNGSGHFAIIKNVC